MTPFISQEALAASAVAHEGTRLPALETPRRIQDRNAPKAKCPYRKRPLSPSGKTEDADRTGVRTGPYGNREQAVPLTFEARAVCGRTMSAPSCALGLAPATKQSKSTPGPAIPCCHHGKSGEALPPRKEAIAPSGRIAGAMTRIDCAGRRHPAMINASCATRGDRRWTSFNGFCS